MKQFWGAIQEMLEKGFYLDEGTYLTIAGSLKKANLDKDVIALKHFNQRMIQENAKDDAGMDMVKLILASDWNEEVENRLHDLKIHVTDNLLMRVLKKIRHYPLKAFHFFEWVGKCQGCQLSSVAYNVMARILAQSDTIKEFQNVILDMRSKGHGMDYDTYIKISRSLQKNKMLKEVVELYEYMMDGPYPPSAQDCILILRSISSSTDVDLTSRVVKKFEFHGNTLSKELYDSIHRSLTSVGKFDEAEKIVETMKNAGYEPDNYIYSQLIFGLRKAGRLEDACKVLEEMEANGCDPDIVTWTILITGLCDAHQMDMALLYFAKMMEKNIDPDADLLDVLVKGFIAQKKLDGAYKLVVEMVKKANLKPWQATYKLLTKKLLEARKLDEALKIIPMMKRHGYPPFTEAFVLHISKLGTVEDARTLMASLSVKQLPSASAHLLVLKSFINEGRLFEAKDILYSCPPHIRSHREVMNLFGATESSSTVPASSVLKEAASAERNSWNIELHSDINSPWVQNKRLNMGLKTLDCADEFDRHLGGWSRDQILASLRDSGILPREINSVEGNRVAEEGVTMERRAEAGGIGGGGDDGGSDAAGGEDSGHIDHRHHVAWRHVWDEDDVKSFLFSSSFGSTSMSPVSGGRWSAVGGRRQRAEILKLSD
ncbi:hypothetical protein V2J09_011777 [Rumex salicifolius]